MTGAIDIGGTNIKYGVVRALGEIEWERSTPTLALEGRDAVISRLRNVVVEIQQQSPEISSIGIGVPGVVNPSTMRVQSPPNLPGWDNVDLIAALESALPISIENDANAAALGEAMFGAGRGVADFLYVTLGTGIGGGVILNGELYRGPHGDAGEVGHIILDAWAREGARDARLFRTGVMEDYVGIQGILRMAHEHGEDATNVMQISNTSILVEAGRLIGVGLCSALAVLGLRTVIIGGGIAQAPYVFESISETMHRRAIPTIASTLLVVRAHFGHKAGLIGAAAVGRSVLRS